MKLNGVLGDSEPVGMPGTLPHWMTRIERPWKCSSALCQTSFQLPPSPAVGLQPGLMLPPKLCTGPFGTSDSNLAPPPVSQHAPLGGGGVSRTVIVNGHFWKFLPSLTRNSYWNVPAFGRPFG